MRRKLKDYHSDVLLYRNGQCDTEREVVKTAVEYWDTDDQVYGTRDHWRVTLWGENLELLASALFPFDVVLVLGEREL
jgi:hypothetical protein